MTGMKSQSRIIAATKAKPHVFPDIDSMVSWLIDGPILTQDGSVLSWRNPNNEGFPYPEAGGLWLILMTQLIPTPTQDQLKTIDRVAAWLCRLSESGDGVGKNGRSYLFDTAIVMNGLLQYRVRGGRIDTTKAIESFARNIETAINSNHPVLPQLRTPDDHWSVMFGSHLIKVAIAMLEYERIIGSFFNNKLYSEVVDDLIPLFDGRRFRVGFDSQISYIHGACYALEGLLTLHLADRGNFESILDPALDWLVSIQDESGGLPAFADNNQSWGDLRSDATAQALRLWLLWSPDNYADPIQSGLSFLHDLQATSGAICYTAEQKDHNTWATLFALQATNWATSKSKSGIIC